MDKDSDFLFEAYQKIYEAPIGPGSSWDDEVSIDPGQSERLAKTQYGGIGEEDIYRIIQNVKEFLSQHEGTVYPGNMEDLKHEIKNIIQNTVEGVNATKAGYAARVFRNELKRLNVIDDTVDGTNLEVQDVEKVDSLTDEMEDALETDAAPVIKSPSPIQLSGEYNVDRDDLPMSASEDAKEAHAALLKAGMAFGTHLGKDILKASGFPYNKAKGVVGELEKLGVVAKAEQEDSGEDKVVDVGDEGEDDYDAAVSSEYDKLRRDIAGGESPVMRPDDF